MRWLYLYWMLQLCLKLCAASAIHDHCSIFHTTSYFCSISMPASCSLLDQRSQKLRWISVMVLFSHQKMCRQVGNNHYLLQLYYDPLLFFTCIYTSFILNTSTKLWSLAFSHVFTLVSFWTQALRTLFNVAHRLHNILGPSWVLVSSEFDYNVPFFI
jgi:hypothetical protein